MITHLASNEYGTPVAAGICDTCGQDYTVSPPPEPDHYDCWRNCLTPECASYDIERDADLWFEPLAEHGLVHRS